MELEQEQLPESPPSALQSQRLLFRLEHDSTTSTAASSLAPLTRLNPGTMTSHGTRAGGGEGRHISKEDVESRLLGALFEDRVRNAEAGCTGSGAMRHFLGSSGYSKHVIEEEAESGRDSMMDMDN